MKSHLKAFNVPNTWKEVGDKSTTFLVRPNSGAHTLDLGMPLSIVLKKLGYTVTTREVKKALNTQNILVDGSRKKEAAHSFGFMDVLTIEPTDEHYRCLFDENGQLIFAPIKKENSKKKISKIIGKTVLRKGKLQLNLNDGRNLLVDKQYNIGDSIVLSVPDQKVLDVLPLKEGASVYLIGGKHVGDTGKVEKIQGEMIAYKSKENQTIQTLKKYAFAFDEKLVR